MVQAITEDDGALLPAIELVDNVPGTGLGENKERHIGDTLLQFLVWAD